MTPLSSPARLAALRRTALLDSPPEAAFDRLTTLTATVFGAPVALISLVDEDRQFFKSAVGLPEPLATVRQTPLSHAICRHEVETGEPLLIDDARTHPLVRDNGAVAELGVVAYAGAPLSTSDGHVLGSLCVIGREPRTWTARDRDILTALAASVVTEVVLRQHSAQRAAEGALRDAHATLATMIDVSPLAIVTVDMELKVTSWNRAAERTYGWTAEEVVGRSLPIITEDRRAAVMRQYTTPARESHGAASIEVRHRRKDDTVVEVRAAVAPLRDGAGTMRGHVAFIADVTEQNRLEDQLRQSQKMEAVGLLAGGIAHDFNNLLTVIRSYADLLEEELGAESTLRDDVREILEAADRATALTRQLLAFSRKQLLQPQALDLNAVVASAEPLLRRLITEDIAMAHVPGPALGRITADRGQLEQVLMNLVVNARDAMPQGGTLTIETENLVAREPAAHLHGVAAAGSYVVLRVRDTGHGMDAETRQHAFDPFFTTKGPGRGTGLGLSTVYGIIRQSGGHIWLDSAPGRGTTVTLCFPRSEGKEPSLAADAHAPAARGAGTILLCEDEQAVRELARRILEHHGYTVLAARHGQDALRLAAEHDGAIDLLITDVVMPEMGGRPLAEALVATRPGIKVLYMSGYTDDVILQRGTLHPRRVFVQKPFVADQLVRAAREMLAV